jgi:hypothetical protein
MTKKDVEDSLGGDALRKLLWALKVLKIRHFFSEPGASFSQYFTGLSLFLWGAKIPPPGPFL